MAIRQVIECDACGKSEPWEDMLDNCAPDGWYIFKVAEFNDTGEPLDKPLIGVVVCGAHGGRVTSLRNLAKALVGR